MEKAKEIDKNNFKYYLKKSYKTIIIIAIFLLLTYWARLISDSFSIDTELYIQEYTHSFDWWLNLERWGLVILNKILKIGPLIIPHANFLTVLFIFVYSILYCYLFYLSIGDKYKEKYLKYQFIFPIIFITSPIFAEQYNFINQNASVSLAICFVATSLILLFKSDNESNIKNKYILIISSLILSTIAFGTYQSIIPLYILSVVACYILKCISDEDSSWKYLIKRIIIFGISAVLYLLISKILRDGNTYLNSGWQDSGLICFRNIYYVIVSVLKCETVFYNVSYLIAIAMIIIVNVYLFFKKKNNAGIIISSIGLLLSPFFIMIITGVDQLKRTQFNYSFAIGFIFLIFAIVFSNKKTYKFLSIFIIVLSLGVAYNQSTITSKLFYSDNVRYQNDVLYANKIQSMIEQKEWYDSNKKYKLIFVGKKEAEAVNNYLKGEVIGKSFFEFDYEYSYGVTQRVNALFATLGYFYEKPTDEEFEDAKEYVLKNNIKFMPSSDSIINKDDKIIIRLSQEL